MSASNDVLQELHAAVADALLEIVKHGVPVFNKEGEETGMRKASAAELNAAATFLKHNDITADLSTNPELQELREALEARRKARAPVIPDIAAGEPIWQ